MLCCSDSFLVDLLLHLPLLSLQRFFTRCMYLQLHIQHPVSNISTIRWGGVGGDECGVICGRKISTGGNGKGLKGGSDGSINSIRQK